MKNLLYFFSAVVLVILAFWAYRVNYETQQAEARVEDLRFQIARERENIAVLRAEWAYLNRPDRLRELAELYFPDLKLMPLNPEHFATPGMVVYPSESVTIQNAIEAAFRELEEE
jgi:hypothetical protein